MPLLLDTFNVLHTVGVLPPDLAGLDIPALARLIASSRHRGEKVTFVCDGLPHDGLPPPGRLELDDAPSPEMMVRYSGPSVPADDLIRDLINASTAPRRLTVVSSDHLVQRHARRRRCIVLTSAEFLEQLAVDANMRQRPAPPARSIPSGMSTEQIEQWVRVFDIDEQAIADTLKSESEPPASKSPQSHRQEVTPPAPTDAPPVQSSRDLLPDGLIEEAERLWSVNQPPRSAQPSAGPPHQSGSDESETSLQKPADDDDGLDMSRILPNDGRTQRLRKRPDRKSP